MKFLKYLLLLVLALIVAFLIYTFLQPNTYDVKRSRVIKAPIATVFNTINDYRTWEKWGPWMEEDSTIVASYPEKTSGVGASYSWTSKDGPGTMKTLALEPNKSITQEIQFGDFEPSGVYWEFDEVPEGTKLTWGMKSDNIPFIFKFFLALDGGADASFGKMEDKGLENIDALMQDIMKNAPQPSTAFSIGTPTEKELPAQNFIGYYHKVKIDHEKITKLFMQDMPKAGTYAMSKLAPEDMVPAAVYKKWDVENGEVEMYIGILTKKPLAPAEGMQQVALPGGKTVMISKYGNYGTGDQEAHTALDNYFKTNKLEREWPIWELYVNDPTLVKPEEIQTDIYYPVK